MSPEKDFARTLRRGLARPFLSASVNLMTKCGGEAFFRLVGMRKDTDNYSLKLCRRIIVIALERIGDTVLLSPFLKNLRDGAPHARISIVVTSEIFNLIERCPYVDEVLIAGPTPKTARMSLPKIWAMKPDLVVVPRWDIDYHYSTRLAYLTGARWRATYSENVSPEKQRINRGMDSLFNLTLHEREPVYHEIERNLRLGRFIGLTGAPGPLQIWLDETDHRNAQAYLMGELKEVQPRLLVGLGIGASANKRKWPVDRFTELVKWMITNFHAHVVIFGSDADHAAAAMLAHTSNAIINACGRLTIRESAALMQRCGIFIGNDSGPKHLASISLPVVEISCHPLGGDPFDACAPERFRARGTKPSIVIQPTEPLFPCSDKCLSNDAHCILQIDVATVRREVANFLDNLQPDRFHP